MLFSRPELCTSSIRRAWTNGDENVNWHKVVEYNWLKESNLRLVMKSGQSFSIRCALGACHGVTPNEENVFHIVTRLCSNRSATLDKLSVDNIIKHHTGEVAWHHMHHGNVVFPIFPRDLSLLEDCPSVVIDDHI